MTKLSANDAAFIYSETDDSPMSIASLQVLELPPDTDIDTFVASLKDYIGERTHLVPYLTNKLQWASGLLDHPNWVQDTRFDIDKHIYTVAVPAPGDRAALEQTAARLHEMPLDRNRPRWDLAVLTGLERGRIAYYNRVHHACLDGMAAQASTQLLMDAEGESLSDKQPLPGKGGKPRSLTDHAFSLFTSLAQEAIDNATAATARARDTMRLMQALQEPGEGVENMYAPSPHTPINRPIDNRRSYATAELPIPALRNIGRQFGCTVNDVFLALCGGGLREYLKRHNALPAATMHAGCPVSLRKRHDKTANNQVSMMRVPLASDVEDPLARLLAVRDATRRAKSLTAAGSSLLPANFTMPGLGLMLRGAQLSSSLLGLADRTPPPFNVLISNVPGPQVPLTSNGARLLTHYPVSIPAHGIGVNITVQSYLDTLYVGITTATRVAPDVDRLRDDLLCAFAALSQAVSAEIVQLSPSPEKEKSVEKQIVEGEIDEDTPRVA